MTTTLVLGASGTVGGEVARLLADAGHTVRRATSRTAGAGQVHLDLLTQAGLDRAIEGAQAAFLMAPPGHTNQDELLGPVIERALVHGVQKVVLMTAMGADADPSAPMRRAELHLEGSGLAWNVIRPNWFMQNFHTYWLHGIREHHAIQLPTGSARGSFIDTREPARRRPARGVCGVHAAHPALLLAGVQRAPHGCGADDHWSGAAAHGGVCAGVCGGVWLIGGRAWIRPIAALSVGGGRPCARSGGIRRTDRRETRAAPRRP